VTNAEIANSKARVRLLCNKAVWNAFDAHFESDWQSMETRDGLIRADVNLRLVGEWAIWSFHELAKEEAQWKRDRGDEFKRAHRMLIESCNRNAAVYRTYASLPTFASGLDITNKAFSGLVEQSLTQVEHARQFLTKAENSGIFNSRRLGSNWNCQYLALLKHYISSKTKWDDSGTINAVTKLVKAAHTALGRACPSNLRVLLQKAIRHFEHNPENATLLALVQSLVLNRQQLYQMFPPLHTSAQSSG